MPNGNTSGKPDRDSGSFYLYANAQTEAETALLVPFFKSDATVGSVVCCHDLLRPGGHSNAVNLTDGLDGLAIVPTILVAGAFAIFAYVTGNVNFSEYLQIPYIPLTSELVIVCTAIVGAGLGFLWFNTYPAMVFMGDVGSLALGGALGIIAVLVREERYFLLWAVFCDGDTIGDIAGRFIEIARAANFQNGAYPSPLRT